MATGQSSKVVYEGEVLIAEFDPDRLDELEPLLEDVVDVSEGEELHVSMPGGDTIEVRKLEERTLD